MQNPPNVNFFFFLCHVVVERSPPQNSPCSCCPQDPVLRDKCSDGGRGGQGGANAVGPGHEADGAVRRQASCRSSQWERGCEAWQYAAR